MATPDVPEAAHYHPCDGIFCAPGGVLVGWSAEPPVLESNIRADERARVLDEVQAVLLREADDEAQRPNRDCCSRSIEEWLREAARIARDTVGASE